LRFFAQLSAWEALCLIYIVSHFGERYWVTDEIYERISNKAYQANYQGEWQTVDTFLRQYPRSPSIFYEIWLTVKSPEEFFGNLRRRAKRVAMLIKIQKRDSTSRPVRTPQRARGYKDKGTLRPPHQFHGDPPLRDGEKQDFRHLVGHPLLYQGVEENREEDRPY